MTHEVKALVFSILCEHMAQKSSLCKSKAGFKVNAATDTPQFGPKESFPPLIDDG